jgi:hypothetical protein
MLLDLPLVLPPFMYGNNTLLFIDVLPIATTSTKATELALCTLKEPFNCRKTNTTNTHHAYKDSSLHFIIACFKLGYNAKRRQFNLKRIHSLLS